MKKKILVLLAFLIASTAFAQTKDDKYEKARQEVLAKATHIFEGIVVPFTKTEIPHATSGYPIDKINVVINKIFRGKYYSIGDTITVTHYSPFSRSMPNWGGVFFCVKDTLLSLKSNNNSYMISDAGNYVDVIDYTPTELKGDTTMPELAGYYAHGYSKRDAFYNYLAKQKNIKIRLDSKRVGTVPKTQIELEKERLESVAFEIEQERRREIFMAPLLKNKRLYDSLKLAEKKSPMRSAKGDQIMAGGNFTYYIENQTLTTDFNGDRFY